MTSISIIIIIISIIAIIAATTLIRPKQDARINDEMTSEEYADIKADQRTDAIIDELHRIHFWLAIIGVYFIIQLLITFMLIACYGTAFATLIKILSDASQTFT